MLDLRSRLTEPPNGAGRAPWPGHEYVKGWGVFGLPFESGDVLALRVFPESDFGSYHTLWHRNSIGEWSIYVDGPSLETACPRYYGPACRHTGFAKIGIEWTGPSSLRVTMPDRALDWTLNAGSTRTLRALNAVSPRMPLATWRSDALVRARELVARACGLGRLQMRGTMPSGHVGILMPQRMYFIDEAQATLEGRELGRPTRLERNPTIGSVTLPARGTLAIGLAMWKIRDVDEFDSLRRQEGFAPSLEAHEA